MIYSEIKKQDYVIEKFYSNASMGFELESSSIGIVATFPDDLIGAVTLDEATSDYADESINPYSEIQKYVLYKSVKHNFYDNAIFYSGSLQVTQSIIPQPTNSYVVSIGSNFYGERVRPGSFQIAINSINETVNDDGYGNLFVSESATGSYVGNIFYDNGIAVIKQDINMASGDVSGSGIKIVGGDTIYLNYDSEVQLIQHEITVDIQASQFNRSNNPSLDYNAEITSSFSQSLEDLNAPVNSDGTYNYYRLMASGHIKPYITTIGFYDDSDPIPNLVAIAKISGPIQRTFDTNQIFIVRFQETGYDGI